MSGTPFPDWQTAGGEDLLADDNVWTGTNEFTGGLSSTTTATANNDIPNFAQVKSLVSGALTPVTPVTAFVNVNLVLSGLQTVNNSEGVPITLIVGNRVCASNQTVPLQNARYVVASGAWTLDSDCQIGSNQSDTFFSETSTGNQFQCTSKPGIMGTNVLTYVLFSENINTSIGTFDSQTPSSNALTIINNVLYGQSASASNPGMLNVGTQTLGGPKTFSQLIASSNNTNLFSSTGTITVVDSNTNQNSFVAKNTFQPTSGSNYSSAFTSANTYIAPAAQTIGSADFHSNSTFLGNVGLVFNAIGFFYDGLAIIAGTVENIYGGVFNSPPSGSTGANQAIYAANMSIGDTSLNLHGTNDLHVVGKTKTSTFQMTTGATNNYYLKSDASGNASWAAGDGGVTTVGTIDSQTPSSDGAVIIGNTFYLQNATTSNPGLMSTTTQNFLGEKTFQQIFVSTINEVAFYATGTSSLVDGNNNQNSFHAKTTFQPTNGSTYTNSFFTDSSYQIPLGKATNVCADFHTRSNTTTNFGAIQSYIGFYYESPATIVGTQSAYGGFFNSPSSGTTNANMAIYAANMSIGDSTLNMQGTNNLAVSGTTITANFRLTSSPASGDFLTSDSSGNGSWAALPVATASINGVVSTTTQTFAGDKTFTGKGHFGNSNSTPGQGSWTIAAVNSGSAAISVLDSTDGVEAQVWCGNGEVVFGSYTNTLVHFKVNNNTVFYMDTNLNTVLGTGALSTGATTGFVYIPTCAGTPTGVPTAITGMAAMVFNTSTNLLQIYNSGWHAQ